MHIVGISLYDYNIYNGPLCCNIYYVIIIIVITRTYVYHDVRCVYSISDNVTTSIVKRFQDCINTIFASLLVTCIAC